MAENLEISVRTGAKKYAVRDVDTGDVIGTFYFNPTDLDIVTRYQSAVDYFNGVEFREDMTAEQSFDAVVDLSNKIKEQVDYIMGYPVSSGLFGKCNPMSPTESGEFFYEQALERISGLIEETMNQRMEKKLEKVRKATAKYSGK